MGLRLSIVILLAFAAPAWAQSAAAPFDDGEAQLRIRVAANVATAAKLKVEELRRALDAERQRVVANDGERELNQALIARMERELGDAEARQRELEAALRAAQEARARGLASPVPEPRRPDADDAERKAAEAGEAEIGLTPADRQKIQIGLAALGFGGGGVADGVLGPRSRETIADWQRSTGAKPTGFLTAPQFLALMKQAAPVIARHEADQKRKADDDARARQAAAAPPSAPTPPPAPAPAAPPPAAGARDGLWFGAVNCNRGGRTSVNGTVAGGTGTLTGGGKSVVVTVVGDQVSLSIPLAGGGTGQLQGRLNGRSVIAQGTVGEASAADKCTASLVAP